MAKTKMVPVPLQGKKNLFREDGLVGGLALRVTHRKEHRRGRRIMLPRYLVRCGCCNQGVELYYDESALEINGVNSSVENWREVLLPLLGIKQTKQGLKDLRAKGKRPKKKSGQWQFSDSKGIREQFL